MRFRVASVLPFGAIGVLVWACDPPPPTLASPLDFCAAKASAMCQVATVCAIDETGCKMFENSQCVREAIAATMPRTRLYDANNARACVDALDGAYGNDNALITFPQIGEVSDACARVFQGTGAPGDSCAVDYDCASGLVCAQQVPGGNILVCATPTPLMQGQSCVAPGSQCPADTYCANQKDGSWICAPTAGAGQACIETSCSATEHCVGGVCQPRGGKGAPCVTNGDCLAETPYCDPFANECAVGLTFAPGAADCMGIAGLGVTTPPPIDGGAAALPDAGAPVSWPDAGTTLPPHDAGGGRDAASHDASAALHDASGAHEAGVDAGRKKD